MNHRDRNLDEVISTITQRQQIQEIYKSDRLTDKSKPINFKYRDEYHFAFILEEVNAPWEYRRHEFFIENKRYYIPSFYLPRENVYLDFCKKDDLSNKEQRIRKLMDLDKHLNIKLVTMDPVYEILYQQIRHKSDTVIGILSTKKGFAHESEKEFATLLEKSNISWRYEPVTFPLEEDVNRKIIPSFSPDFHLPQFDLYLELTTSREDQATKKNIKITKFREKYPDENLEVIYGTDYQKLVDLGILKNYKKRQLELFSKD